MVSESSRMPSRRGNFRDHWSLPVMGSSMGWMPCASVSPGLCHSLGGGQSPQLSVSLTLCLSVLGSSSNTPGNQQPSNCEGLLVTALKDTRESHFWAHVCSINAIVLMCVNIFCYAYFA